MRHEPPSSSDTDSSRPSSTPSPAAPALVRSNSAYTPAARPGPTEGRARIERSQTGGAGAGGSTLREEGEDKLSDTRHGPAWTTLDLLKLTIGITGAQLAWTVQTAYGTPYLLELGLTKTGTSLVWLAGPLGGLIVQPIIGALSDSSPSRFRRRQFIVVSTAIMLASSLAIAFAKVLASPLVIAFTRRDEGRDGREATCAIWIAVLGVYVLVAALNALQTSIRALVLDLAPPRLESAANASIGRLTQVANILGYLAGYLDLDDSPLLRWIGAGQLRKLALISCVALVVTVSVTCWTQHEKARPELRSDEGAWRKIVGVVRHLGASVRTLPKAVKWVCYVQFFAWSGFFPFIFYSTTYVAEAYTASLAPGVSPPSPDTATRAGSFALLIYAIVSLAAGTLLPYLTTLATSFPSLPPRVGRIGRWALCALSLRNLWTFSLGWFAACMCMTFWVESVRGTTTVVALVGVSWAVTCWVPYALVMESILTVEAADRKALVRPDPTDPRALLLQHGTPTPAPRARAVAAEEVGGAILGLHNLSIVLPQFVVVAVAAGIFRLAASASSSPGAGETGGGDDGTVWVLRFGGLVSALGVVASRWLVEPPSERRYRDEVLHGWTDKSGADSSEDEEAKSG